MTEAEKKEKKKLQPSGQVAHTIRSWRADVNIKIREVGLWAEHTEQKWLILYSRNPSLILRLNNILSHTTHNIWWHALNELKNSLQIGSLKFNRRWSKGFNTAAAVTWLQSTLRFLWILNVSFSTLPCGTGSVHDIFGEGWCSLNVLFNVGCKTMDWQTSCDFHSAPQSITTITWHQLSNECTELILYVFMGCNGCITRCTHM